MYFELHKFLNIMCFLLCTTFPLNIKLCFDRFHDAQDNILTSLDKCFICDKTFSSADSPQDRNDHANGHFDPAIEPNSLDLQKCPVCTQVFPKNHVTPEAFEQHVQSHFAETNYTPPLTRGEFNA